MFGLFKKKPALPAQIDKVWKSEREKNAGIIKDINQFVGQGQSVVLFYFFDQSRAALNGLLAERQLDFSEDITANKQLFLINANDIDRSAAFASTMTDKFRKDVVKLFFAEHYPTKTLENILIETLKDMSEEAISPVYYVSLEDKLMTTFGSERIIKVMESPIMGMKDGDCIEHKMVSQSIVNAQQKLESNVQNEVKCDSQEEWFERNLPK